MSEKTQEPIHQRLVELINSTEAGVQRRFAQRIGVGSGVIGDMLGQRKTKPGLDILTKILAAYPTLRAEWLMRGTGTMFSLDETDPTPPRPASSVKVVQDEMPVPYKGSDNLRVLTVQVADDNEENIEFVSTRAAAGYAQGGFLEREFIGNLPSFRLPDAVYRNGSFRCFQVSGDSMQSTLYDGDWVVCRYVEQWDRDVQDTYVHVVVTEDTVLVKRLTNQLNERGKLSLHSDNPAYPVQFIDGAEVREVWVAVAKVSRQFINPRYDVGVELARHDAVLAEVLQRLDRAGF